VVVEDSARRWRAVPGIKEVNKVWKWVVVEEDVSSYLQGNHVLARLWGMQNLASLDWNTVSSSDMNPKSINSALYIHPQYSIRYTIKHTQNPSIYVYINVIES
jgi:hypothetical protein